MNDPLALAEQAVAALVRRGQTLAVAESLTGGGLGAAVTAVPGASGAFRGGVTAYATEVKAELLGVDDDLLARSGAVDPEVAVQMARGVRARLRATYGLATTGVAGPDPQDGRPPGEVHVALSGPAGDRVRSVQVHGGRADVRAEAVRAALALLVDTLDAVRKASG